jgi:anaerobic selenocysteine-containing dehydrogenase
MSDQDRPIQLANRHDITRRDVLRAFAAGVAALEVGCLQRPGEEIRPAVNNPESHPGTSRRYATAFVEDGFATGLVVESHEGRPTKVEGNPGHPASLGGTSAQQQASILDLYDPYRLRAPQRAGVPASWNHLRAALATPVAGETWIVMPP